MLVLENVRKDLRKTQMAPCCCRNREESREDFSSGAAIGIGVGVLVLLIVIVVIVSMVLKFKVHTSRYKFASSAMKSGNKGTAALAMAPEIGYGAAGVGKGVSKLIGSFFGRR